MCGPGLNLGLESRLVLGIALVLGLRSELGLRLYIGFRQNRVWINGCKLQKV